DVAEPEGAAAHAEHGGVRGDQRLTCELAGAVSRYWSERAVILVRLDLTEVAVDAGAGGVEDRRHLRLAGRLDDVVGEHRPLTEVYVRVGDGAGDVRIAREVDARVVALHRALQLGEVVDVAGDDLQPPVAQVLLVVPRLAGG